MLEHLQGLVVIHMVELALQLVALVKQILELLGC